MNHKSTKSYVKILKASSLFGGVQLFNIIIGIIRSKFTALFLGPVGVGVYSLLMSGTKLISALTNCGIGMIAVKNVASANANGDSKEIAKVVLVVNRLVLLTGFLGMLTVIISSRWLSIISFGNDKYTVAFIIISVTVLLDQMRSGHTVLLQGLRNLKRLALSNILGGFSVLLFLIPLYYFFGKDGIVPVIVVASVVSFLFTLYFARKIDLVPVKLSLNETFEQGKGILKLGFLLSINGIIGSIAAYLIRMLIGRVGSIEEVGLYNSGYAIVITYTGMVFSAMATDYFPRLSEVSENRVLRNKLINEQAEIALIFLGPLLSVFLVFSESAISILYSTEFLPAKSFISWAILGIYFKGASWCLGFLFLAKGDSKNYFFNELAASIYMLLINMLGYYLYGLEGIGIGLLISNVLFLIHIYVVTGKLYSTIYRMDFIRIFFIQLSLGILCFMIINLLSGWVMYALGCLIISISLCYSIILMNNRVDLKSLIHQIRNKYGK